MNSSKLTSILSRAVEIIRRKHFAYSTEQSYCDWIKRYWSFLKAKKLDGTSERKAEAFLTYLALRRKVSASTQLLGHKQIQTTCGYRHPELNAASPIDERPAVPRIYVLRPAAA